MTTSRRDSAALREGRRLFETTLLARADIERAAGLENGSLARLAKNGRWRRPSATGRLSREALAARLWNAASRQVAQIEARLDAAANDADPAERERDARLMSIVVKTLHDLVKLDEAEERKTGAAAAAITSEGAADDADDLRRELAQRIDRLRAGGDAPGLPVEPQRT